MRQLTEHFSYEEMTRSETGARLGLDNRPSISEEFNLVQMCVVMEQVRTLLGNSINVHSGFRAPLVNDAVGGSHTSAHLKGFGCDFNCPGFGTDYAAAKAIEASNIFYDQLILEYGWIHLGLRDRDMRRESLTKYSARSPYQSGLHA